MSETRKCARCGGLGEVLMNDEAFTLADCPDCATPARAEGADAEYVPPPASDEAQLIASISRPTDGQRLYARLRLFWLVPGIIAVGALACLGMVAFAIVEAVHDATND